MRSFKEFKIQKSDKSINAAFDRMADEVAYLYTRNIKKITELCSNWATDQHEQAKFRTINEYKLLQELPAIVLLAVNESATEARKLVNKARAEFFNEEETPSIFDSLATFTNQHLDLIFTNLHNDLIKNFGVYRQGQEQGQRQGVGQTSQQKLGWMDRLKKWAANAWHGPDYAQMKQFAQQHGYQPEHRIEPKNLNVLFENVLVESIELLTQILDTHKKEISNLIKQTLSHYDNFKRYGSYANTGGAVNKPIPPSPDEELGTKKMTDYPVVSSTPPSRAKQEPEPVSVPEMEPTAEPEQSKEPVSVPPEPEPIAKQEPTKPKPEEELSHAKELPRRGEANLYKVNKQTKELTFKDHEGREYSYNYDELEKDSDGVPKYIPVGENEKLRVVKQEYKRFRSANRFALHHREEHHVEPEESNEEKIKYIQELEKQDRVAVLDPEDLRKIEKQDNKVFYKTTAQKIIPLDITHPIEHNGFFYFRGAKYKGPMEKWFKADKDLWNAIQEKIHAKPGEEVAPPPKTDEFEGSSNFKLQPDPKIKGKGFDDIPRDVLF